MEEDDYEGIAVRLYFGGDRRRGEVVSRERGATLPAGAEPGPVPD